VGIAQKLAIWGQSAADTHTLAQAGQAPPQSTPVSAPLRTPSLQAGAWQTPALHTLDAQSLATLHAIPSPQAGQPPPQVLHSPPDPPVPEAPPVPEEPPLPPAPLSPLQT
jgi:hypothetical protein